MYNFEQPGSVYHLEHRGKVHDFKDLGDLAHYMFVNMSARSDNIHYSQVHRTISIVNAGEPSTKLFRTSTAGNTDPNLTMLTSADVGKVKDFLFVQEHGNVDNVSSLRHIN